jgi:hypothetical protein
MDMEEKVGGTGSYTLNGITLGILAVVLLGLVIGVWSCLWIPPFP